MHVGLHSCIFITVKWKLIGSLSDWIMLVIAWLSFSWGDVVVLVLTKVDGGWVAIQKNIVGQVKNSRLVSDEVNGVPIRDEVWEINFCGVRKRLYLFL